MGGGAGWSPPPPPPPPLPPPPSRPRPQPLGGGPRACAVDGYAPPPPTPPTLDGAGPHLVLVGVSYDAPLTVGNKLSTDHGHKMVVSGAYPPERLPFEASSGIIPDLFINPLGVEARKVVGLVAELLGGVVVAAPWPDAATEAAAAPRLYAAHPWLREWLAPDGAALPDVTPFEEAPGKLVAGLLAAAAAKRLPQTTTLIDPFSGLAVGGVALGITTVYVLRHIGVEKLNAVAAGPVALITGAATRGRGNEGGAKQGQMDLSCLMAAGAPMQARARARARARGRERERESVTTRAARTHAPQLMSRRGHAGGDFSVPLCVRCGTEAVPRGPTPAADYYAVCPRCAPPGAPPPPPGEITSAPIRMPFIHHLVASGEMPAAGISMEGLRGGM